jgi:hypothetical protein
MATTAQVQAALADAQANALGWGDKAALLRRAIDNAIINGSGECELPWQTTGANGISITRITIKEAVDMAIRFESLDCGGIVGQLVEFS